MSVRAYDPEVDLSGVAHPPLTRCQSPLEASSGVDALVLATAWPEFSTIDLGEVRQRMRGRREAAPYQQ